MSTALSKLRKLSGAGRLIDWNAMTLLPAEIVAAALLVVSVVVVAAFSLFFVTAEKSRIEKLRGDFERNRGEIARIRKQSETPDSSGELVLTALKSLDEFQLLLKPVAEGRRDIIEEVNEIANDAGVDLSDAVQFTPIRESEDLSKPSRSSGEAKSAFPGLGVQFAVEGEYESLREFISKLERSKNFLVINQIQLEGIEELQKGTRGSKRSGKIEKVSLRLNLDTYFQRES